jgi:hypothetical protein
MEELGIARWIIQEDNHQKAEFQYVHAAKEINLLLNNTNQQ